VSVAAVAVPQRATVWRRFRRHHLALVGAAMTAGFVVLAACAPLLPLPDPYSVDALHTLGPPLTPGHPFGTDEVGRDILSRVIWGARISLLISVSAAALALGAGATLGLLAGYLAARADTLIMRVIDVLMAFPYILLALAIVSALGPGLVNAMLAIALVGIPPYARLARASVLGLRKQEFVEAARMAGATDARVLRRHVLPNTLAPTIVMFSLDIGAKMIATAGLSFLGLGTQPPVADWGNMLASGRSYIVVAPHLATFPGLAMFLTVIGFNLLGDGLRDALDPRLR
jgi:peptide/nickel transport system permease protein